MCLMVRGAQQHLPKLPEKCPLTPGRADLFPDLMKGNADIKPKFSTFFFFVDIFECFHLINTNAQGKKQILH